MKTLSNNWKFIDSHVHLDMTYHHNPERLLWLKDQGCLPISWAFASRVDSVSDLRRSMGYQRETIHEIRQNGNECYFLTGVHPRNIPVDLKPKLVTGLLLSSLEDDYCLGIGEIGLEKGTDHEKEILLAQLDLAEEVVERGKIFGIHTPRGNKESLTAEMLNLLKPYLVYRERMVIDHCNEMMIPGVLEAGLWAGITLSPIKTSFQDLEKIIKNHPESLNRIMLNTDSGGHFHDDLVCFYRSGKFEQDVKDQLANLSATRFFGLENLDIKRSKPSSSDALDQIRDS